MNLFLGHVVCVMIFKIIHDSGTAQKTPRRMNELRSSAFCLPECRLRQERPGKTQAAPASFFIAACASVLIEEFHDLVAEVLVERLFHHHGMGSALDFHHFRARRELRLEGVEQSLVDVRILVARNDERRNLQLFREDKQIGRIRNEIAAAAVGAAAAVVTPAVGLKFRHHRRFHEAVI